MIANIVESLYISRVICSTLAPSNNFSHAYCIGIISHTIYEVHTFMGFTGCKKDPRSLGQTIKIRGCARHPLIRAVEVQLH